MEFIPRRNMPEGLAAQVLQLLSRQGPAIAAGIESAGRGLASGIDGALDQMAADKRQGQGVLADLAAKGLLAGPDGQPVTTEGLYKAMGIQLPAGAGGFAIRPKPAETDGTKIKVTPDMAKKYPGLQADSLIPSTYLAELEGKGKDGKGGAGGADQKQLAALANQYRDELNKMSGDFDKITKSYSDIRTVAKKPSAAGDLSMVFSYMKMLDPGSTVREGEQATAENARGIPATIRNTYNKIMSGQKLEDGQRADFLAKAGELYSSQETIQRQREDVYKQLAERNGVDPKNVIVTRGLPKDEPEGGPADGIALVGADAKRLLELRKKVGNKAGKK